METKELINKLVDLKTRIYDDHEIIVIEECSELIKEITKSIRALPSSSSIGEEGCDVLLTVYVLLRMRGISDASIEENIRYKVMRTLGILRS